MQPYIWLHFMLTMFAKEIIQRKMSSDMVKKCPRGAGCPGSISFLISPPRAPPPTNLNSGYYTQGLETVSPLSVQISGPHYQSLGQWTSQCSLSKWLTQSRAWEDKLNLEYLILESYVQRTIGHVELPSEGTGANRLFWAGLDNSVIKNMHSSKL